MPVFPALVAWEAVACWPVPGGTERVAPPLAEQPVGQAWTGIHSAGVGAACRSGSAGLEAGRRNLQRSKRMAGLPALCTEELRSWCILPVWCYTETWPHRTVTGRRGSKAGGAPGAGGAGDLGVHPGCDGRDDHPDQSSPSSSGPCRGR